MEHQKESSTKPSMRPLLHRISHALTSSIQGCFYRLGWSIGSRPWTYVLSLFFIALLCITGILRFRRETRPDRLWVPYDSHFYNASVWLMDNFPSPIRFQYVIVQADDILQPEVIQKVLHMHQKVEEVTAFGKTFEDLCFRLPVVRLGKDGANLIKGLNSMRMPRSIDDDLDFDDGAFDDFDSSRWMATTTKRPGTGPVTAATTTTTRTPIKLNFTKEFSNFDDDMKVEWDTIDDISVAVPSNIYCSMMDDVPSACWKQSILEIWNYDPSLVANLTKEDILEAVNTPMLSPVYGTPMDYRFLLGLPTYNETGQVVAAKALMVRWFTAVNLTALETTFEVLDTGLGDPADKISLEWEQGFIDTVLDLNQADQEDDVKFLVRAWRSFADVGGQGIVNDIFLLLPGYALIFTYLIVMLSEWSLSGLRPVASIMGLLSTFVSFCVSVGICSMMGVEFTPVHNMLGFLLLGLGVDDMFVVAQCWVNLSDQDKTRSLPERMALTMKDAGMAITVTSFTDALAFVVGATTVIPALRSFCIYATVGILSVYVLQATFYPAWFILEEQRREWWERRKLSKKLQTPKEMEGQLSQVPVKRDGWLGRAIMDFYAKYLLTTPGIIIAIITSLSLLALGSVGLSRLRQEFDPIWFLPPDSYLKSFADALYGQFPRDGEEAYVFVTGANYSIDLPVLDKMIEDMRNSPFEIAEVDDWYTDFKEYSNKYFDAGIPDAPITESRFQYLLGRYLFSQIGGRHQKSFEFSGEIACGQPTPPVLATRIPFRFQRFSGPSEHVPAMRNVRQMVATLPFRQPGAWAFVWAYLFCVWEVDEVIGHELSRNLVLASVCVLGATMILLADIRASMLVVLCVGLAVTEVTGVMHFVGLTIDTVSCIGVVLAVGMCVDYAAHIAHAFVHLNYGHAKSRRDRARGAVRMIGPAVVHGVVSTFLAMVCLVGSTSHVFITFFRLFMILLSLGMFHGLVLLPVLLSLLGPPPLVTAPIRFNSTKPRNQVNGDAKSNGTNSPETAVQLQALLKPKQTMQNGVGGDDESATTPVLSNTS